MPYAWFQTDGNKRNMGLPKDAKMEGIQRQLKCH